MAEIHSQPQLCGAGRAGLMGPEHARITVEGANQLLCTATGPVAHRGPKLLPLNWGILPSSWATSKTPVKLVWLQRIETAAVI